MVRLLKENFICKPAIEMKIWWETIHVWSDYMSPPTEVSAGIKPPYRGKCGRVAGWWGTAERPPPVPPPAPSPDGTRRVPLPPRSPGTTASHSRGTSPAPSVRSSPGPADTHTPGGQTYIHVQSSPGPADTHTPGGQSYIHEEQPVCALNIFQR